jgi:hypothetical protein
MALRQQDRVNCEDRIADLTLRIAKMKADAVFRPESVACLELMEQTLESWRTHLTALDKSGRKTSQEDA